MKHCVRCGQEKPLSEFHKNGKAAYCAPCTSAYAKAWREANKEALKVKKAEAYAKDRERIRAQHADYRAKNKEAVAEGKARWRKSNGAAVREYWRKYRAENKARMDEYRKKWQAENPDAYRAVRVNDVTRRQRAVQHGIDANELASWVVAQPKVCFYCEVDCEHEFHIDHFVPISRDGKHEIDNLKIACPPCNQRKAGREPLEFMGLA